MSDYNKSFNTLFLSFFGLVKVLLDSLSSFNSYYLLRYLTYSSNGNALMSLFLSVNSLSANVTCSYSYSSYCVKNLVSFFISKGLLSYYLISYAILIYYYLFLL